MIAHRPAKGLEATDPTARALRPRAQHPYATVGFVAGFEFDHIARFQTEGLAGFRREGRLTLGCEGQCVHGLTIAPIALLVNM
jgi:hypothetical protein